MPTRGMALLNSRGKASRMAGSQTDITERKVYDPLTGLPTRTLFLDRIQTVIDRNERNSGFAFAALSISLDDLKIVANGLGYTDRDQVLTQVARRIQQVLQVNDTAAR